MNEKIQKQMRSYRLPVTMIGDLEAVSSHTGLDASDIVRVALMEYLRKAKQKMTKEQASN